MPSKPSKPSTPSTHLSVQFSSLEHAWLVSDAALLKLHLQPRLQQCRLIQLQLQGEWLGRIGQVEAAANSASAGLNSISTASD
jgi:hypothetical protein